MTLVHGQGHVGEVAQDEHQLLTKDVYTETICSSLKPLESLLHREQGLERSEQKYNILTWKSNFVSSPEHHHDDHHDGEDGDGAPRHVHNEQVHWDLLTYM